MKNVLTSAAIFIALAVSVLLCACTGGGTANNDNSIAMLDSLLERHDELEMDKLFRLAVLKQHKAHVPTQGDAYGINMRLFNEYVTYNADSAMKYINENLAIARHSDNMAEEVLCKIDKAELLTGTGLLNEAQQLLSSIERSTLPDSLLVDYYGAMIYLYSHLGNYAGGDANTFYATERLYKDSIMSVIDESHPDYLWYKGWDVLGTTKPAAETIDALVAKLESNDANTRQYAKDAYILANLFKEYGDMANNMKYMTLSAIADVETVNAEIASLDELAKIMFAQGDIDRAYSYINYSLNKAINYPNRVKAYGISQSLEEINRAYQERNRRQQQRTQFFLILTCALAVILSGTIITIIAQNTRLKEQGQSLDTANRTLSDKLSELSEAQQQLNLANEQLLELNDSLKSKNDELNEANYVKEEYIGYLFTICSKYIGKLAEFKRHIHVKVVTKKYKEIETETADIDMKDELKEFYQSFDSIFLHIYPNFVNDFNSLLQDDKKIIPKEGELLNTELRIYALVRLGINDSVKIAEFLHCSAQTVYNNRFKVRNKAKISRNEFAETVKSLGKFMERSS